MAKGRELKGRIKSVENTRKITRTMEMVATSKMKRAQERVMAARPYATVLTEVISSLYSAELAERFPLLRQPATVRRAAVLEHHQGSAQPARAAVVAERRDRAPRGGTEGARVLSLRRSAGRTLADRHQ
jgi:F-type H+-transporting ATPase subunit gamma